MINEYRNGKFIGVTFEDYDTLMQVASCMHVTVDELKSALKRLNDLYWQGEKLEWEENNFE